MAHTKAENEGRDSVEMDDTKTNLIVNYLPQTMSDEEFRVLFAKYGDLRSARIIRKKSTGYSYGFGFVDYINPVDALKAIDALNGSEVNHKKIKVSFARPSSDEIKNANLYVSNLPPDYDESNVQELFATYGEIIQCRLLSNRAGTAFVLFNLHDEAQNALDSLNNTLIPGTNLKISVKFATNEQKKNLNQERRNNFSNNGGNSKTSQKRPYSNNGMSNHYVQHNKFHAQNHVAMRNHHPASSLHQQQQHDHNNHHHIHNQPPHHRNGSYPSLPMRSVRCNDGPPHLVEPTSYDSMLPSGQYYGSGSSNHTPNAPNLNASWGQRNPPLQPPPIRNDAQYMKMGHHGPSHGTFDDGPIVPHPHHHHSQYQQPAPSHFNGGGMIADGTDIDYDCPDSGGPNIGEHILFVYNIGPETNEFYLGKIFSSYGTVLRVNVIRRGQESRGYGFVTMKYYQDAVNAINGLNGQRFANNKPLQVSFKKM